MLELKSCFKLKIDDKVLGAFRRALEIAKRMKALKEYENFFLALSGNYVEPGASGSLTRGKIEILPTGRNFYGVDPTALPTRAAWEIGVKTAEKLLAHYLEKHGKWPESVGHWLMSIDGYKADGEQLAQILYLLGVRPVWINNAVKEIEVIPLEELKRPRIDVCVRITGIVRDTLPNYADLIQKAVAKIIALDEPLEMNFVRKHYFEQLEKLSKLGISEEFAKCRVWGCKPGAYGAGVNYAVEASAWKSDEDLAKVWIHWSAYAYGDKFRGEFSPEALILNLKNVEVITRNQISDEHDLLNCCCHFSYQGGFYNAVKEIKGKEPEIVVVDTREMTNAEIREMKDEIERIVRAKLLNDRWIEEMKKHGYRGANEFSKKILHLYGWSATTKLVEDWVFDEIAENYVLNEEMKKFFVENNVYALEEIARRLVEAKERGLWKASEERLRRIREIYAEIEGILEEDLVGDVQGGEIRFLNSEDVEGWKQNLKELEKAFEVIK